MPVYGIQTQKALENFALGAHKTRPELIHAMILVKKAVFITQKNLSLLNADKADALIHACDAVLAGEQADAFPLHPLQGGAGTSTHMNVNEVLATLAARELGTPVHPLDDANKGQSTNDVYPTAVRVAAVLSVRKLAEKCAALQESLQKKENEYADVLKLGRTELMDALPVTLGQEFGCYAQAIARDRWRIYKTEERLRQINLGGTAVGTGANADRRYACTVADTLRDVTGVGVTRAEFPMDLTQNNDVFVEVSGLLKALAVNLIKIATDLRLMNSGPNGGFGEITLAAMQAGSTIMPGKVNPVMAEMITQVGIKVMANDTAIAAAAAMGNFELNAFEPLIAECLLDSLELLTNGVGLFAKKCIDPLTANPDTCKRHLDASTVLATALAPHIGYESAAAIVKEACGNAARLKELALQKNLLDGQTLDTLLNYRHEMTYSERK